VVLISGGCALSGVVSSLPAMAAWSGVMGLGHLCFVIGAQSIVARQSAPAEQDRNFGHFTIGASLGQLGGPIAAGALISGESGALGRTSALALLVSAGVCAVALTSLWRIEHRRTAGSRAMKQPAKVPVTTILGARGVPAGIFISMAVLSSTDILTAYLPVVGEHRGIAPVTVGLLLSLRAAATIACRLVMTPMLRLLGRTALLTTSCLLAGLLCAGMVLPVPVPVLAVMLAALGFCLGAGQPLSMTTVVQAAPAEARSTALALRLTGNRLGQACAADGHPGPPPYRRSPRPYATGSRMTARPWPTRTAPEAPAPPNPVRPTHPSRPNLRASHSHTPPGGLTSLHSRSPPRRTPRTP